MLQVVRSTMAGTMVCQSWVVVSAGTVGGSLFGKASAGPGMPTRRARLSSARAEIQGSVMQGWINSLGILCGERR